MSRRSATVFVGAAVATLLLGVPGIASADGGSHQDPPPSLDAGTTGISSQSFDGHQSSQHESTSPGSHDSTSSNASYPSAPSPYPAPGPYGSWDDAFPKNPNADLSWMPGAVDSCGSDWGGDGWNAKYAQPTPCAPQDEDEPAGPPQITAAMVTAAATAVAPNAPPHVQPGALSYVNFPNNYWADAPDVHTSITLLGVTIPLHWAPVDTTWNFGDGGSASGEGVKGADLGAAGAVEHAYGRQGQYAVSTTTAYDLTFVLPDSGAQTVRLTAPPSPPVTLPVREIQTRTDYVG